jgi:hypothetical protein
MNGPGPTRGSTGRAFRAHAYHLVMVSVRLAPPTVLGMVQRRRNERGQILSVFERETLPGRVVQRDTIYRVEYIA